MPPNEPKHGRGSRKSARRTNANPVKPRPGKQSPGQPSPVSLVVGIGASAGGLDAYRTLFTAMPANTGMAFVLVQHLDPDHASALVEILRNNTKMEVSQVENGTALAANQVFVIPPDAIMKLKDGVLQLTSPATPIERRTSIDTFFVSLAEDQRENAVGIILSGYGSDGVRGVTAIKEHGGLTLAQAEFDHSPKVGMPQSAASSGFVDHVLQPQDMPAELIRHLSYRKASGNGKQSNGVRNDVAPHLSTICAVLSSRLGRDFSQYKTNTVMRRVQRRMQVLQIDDVPSYIEQLRIRANEPALLVREILIGVTNFFRDPEAFKALASKVIPKLLATGGATGTIRVWVAGCATGEEAYSVAILFKEALAQGDRPRQVQIFATDLNDHAVELARAGVYPGSAIIDMPPELVERYFSKEGDQYRIARALREMCVFSVHDLVKDPPFSKLSLICCRNLLIYFGLKLQKRVFAMFHYGLQPDGVLFLGSSEAVAAQSALFSPLDKKSRLFQRRSVPGKVVIPDILPPAAARARAKANLANDGDLAARVTRIMARYTPAYVIVDRQQHIHQFSGAVAKFLEPASGAASLNLSALIHHSLRAPVQGALKEAIATKKRVIAEGLVVELAGRKEAVTIVVEPLLEPETDGLAIVAFQEMGPAREIKQPDVAPGKHPGSRAVEELAAAREKLQTVTEELETANEELQSSNEEYQTVNEELQSTNEELETSKEELQSINEELHTINAELSARNDNLADVNSDLTNLIDSTSIATLFLDNEMRIKRFTPAILEIFNLREGDVGRPISDIVSHLARDGLAEDVQQVIRTLTPLQREVEMENTNDTSYQMQIRPYRTSANVINGAVITFVDISHHKQSARDRAKLSAIVESSEDAIISHDLDGKITSWNAGAETIYGYSHEEALGRSMATLLSTAQELEWATLLTKLRRGEVVRHFDSQRTTKSGSIIDVSLTISPIKDDTGEIIGASAVARDISIRKQAERQSVLLLGELDHRVKNILAVVSAVVRQTLQIANSPADFAASVEGRIQAIAKAHSLFTHEGRGGALLSAVVKTELAPYEGASERVTISGGDVTLTPKAGMALAMAFHELTTNATKYGALSAATGRLAISWDHVGGVGNPILRILWTESGGPAVQPPTRRGFGTALIERSLSHEFDAVVKREFQPAGLHCAIELPLTNEVGYLGVRDLRAERFE